jgi:hypothetical protein
MAFSQGYKSRVLAGDFNISTVTTDWSEVHTVDMLDTTVLTSGGVKTFIPGQDTSTLSVSGLLDVDGAADGHLDQLNDWKAASAEPVTIAPRGLTVGSECVMANALEASFSTSAAISDRVLFALECQTDGATDFGVLLHDLEAETADGNETSVNNSASSAGGGVGHLHVTALSGLTSMQVAIQDSADDAVWADLIAFTASTAAEHQRLTVSGTVDQYVRAEWDATGTGSCTFAVAFARR